MLAAPDTRRAERVAEIVRLARSRLGADKSASVAAFIEAFYADVAGDELGDRAVEDLYGAAYALWQLGLQRNPGEAIWRAFNPGAAEHGWESPHSVVQVVNDDMPFLVDSVTAELNRRDLTVHAVLHPIVRVKRAPGAAPDLTADGARESFMHLEIDQQPATALAEVEAALRKGLADVRGAVGDWKAVLGRVDEALAALDASPPPVDAVERDAAKAFLGWLRDDHFTFLGYREYLFEGEGEGARAGLVPGRGLGLCRDDEFVIFRGLRTMGALPPDVQAFLRERRLLNITKANTKSTVHRSVHLDAVMLKTFDAAGRASGQKVSLGLFTSTAYSQSPRAIPLLAGKVERVAARAGFPPASHNAKALWHVLESYPRDELFQVTDDELYDIALGILRLQERQRTAAFIRRDPFGRFCSVLVYTPRDRYDERLRHRFGELIARALAGEVSSSYTHIAQDDTVLMRLHYIIRTKPGQIPPVDGAALNRDLSEAARGYGDKLR